MAILTAAEVADLRAEITDAQTDTMLTLYRYNQNTGQDDAIGPYAVQVAYPDQMVRAGGLAGTEQALARIRFYREPPFDARTGDMFTADGHPGGVIRRVSTDPVLGVIVAEGDYDVGTA